MQAERRHSEARGVSLAMKAVAGRGIELRVFFPCLQLPAAQVAQETVLYKDKKLT